MKEKLKNKKVVYAIIGIVAVLLVAIVITYAYWLVTKTQTKENVISTGCLDISITNELNDIKLLETEPISDSEGKRLIPYEFTVTNTCDGTANYEISLETFESTTTMQDSSIKVMVDNDTPTILTSNVQVDPTISGATKSYVLKSGTLSTKGTTGAVENHTLRIWIDEDAPMSEMGRTFESKISVTVGQEILNPKLCMAATAETVTTGNIPEGNYENGDEYICEVKDDTFYHFFVIGKENTGEINLIMDRNVGSDGNAVTADNLSLVAWVSPEDYASRNAYEIENYREDAVDPSVYCNNNVCVEEGAISAIEALYDYLDSWNLEQRTYDMKVDAYIVDTNVDPEKVFVPDTSNTTTQINKDIHAGYDFKEILYYLYNQVDEEGNRRIAEPLLKARLMTIPEVLANGCLVEYNTVENGETMRYNVNSCPLYLSNYLQHKRGYVPGENDVNADKAEHINGIRGYWLMNGGVDCGYIVHDNGSLNSNYAWQNDYAGIRPVITLDLSNFNI